MANAGAGLGIANPCAPRNYVGYSTKRSVSHPFPQLTLVDMSTCQRKCGFSFNDPENLCNVQPHGIPSSNRDFRYLWMVNTLSGCGDQFFFVALPWLVLQLTGSGAVLGGMMMVSDADDSALR
jgi:hypothetical protein